MTVTTNAILESLLNAIASKRGFPSPPEVAEWIIGGPDGWDECGMRARFYPRLAAALQRVPFDFDAVRSALRLDEGILGGHQVVSTRIGQFLDADRAPTLLRALVADGAAPPDAHTIDRFVEAAVQIAFTDRAGKPDASGATLLASVLLTASFPDRFVDYRRDRWRRFAEFFDLPLDPDSTHGEMLHWAGDAARAFRATDAFQSFLMPAARDHLGVNHPHWVISGLPYYWKKGSPIYPYIAQVNRPNRSRRHARSTSAPTVQSDDRSTPYAALDKVLAKLRDLQKRRPVRR